MENRFYILAQELADVLTAEYEARCTVVDLRAAAEIVAAAVIRQATIDGKNADTRKTQRRVSLAESAEYQEALTGIARADATMALAAIERRRVEAIVELTKAWLYSQRE